MLMTGRTPRKVDTKCIEREIFADELIAEVYLRWMQDGWFMLIASATTNDEYVRLTNQMFI